MSSKEAVYQIFEFSPASRIRWVNELFLYNRSRAYNLSSYQVLFSTVSRVHIRFRCFIIIYMCTSTWCTTRAQCTPYIFIAYISTVILIVENLIVLKWFSFLPLTAFPPSTFSPLLASHSFTTPPFAIGYFFSCHHPYICGENCFTPFPPPISDYSFSSTTAAIGNENVSSSFSYINFAYLISPYDALPFIRIHIHVYSTL